ncbi:MAG: competence/damage-inducible protein A [Simkaniaceae bacterium]
MKIEIISIGSELLRGKVRNANAEFLCRILLREGWETSRVTVVADRLDEIAQEIRRALLRSDIVIMTGGLGPTSDDVTKSAVAEALESEIAYDEDLARTLQRAWKESCLVKEYAYIPKISSPILNEVGKAPGLLSFYKGKILAALPGVPVEMEAMFQTSVLPLLQDEMEGKAKKTIRDFYFFQLGETEINEWTMEHLAADDLEIGIYPFFGRATLTVAAPDQKRLDSIENKLRKDFKDFLYSTADERIEKALHDLLVYKKISLALAESCTGGSMAARISAIAGASQYFTGSFVAYSNEMKMSALDVSAKSLANFGAVSEQAAKEMALGALEKSNADVVLSVTGIAGPSGGTALKPIGTVYAAIAEKKTKNLSVFSLPKISQKTRHSLIEYTATYLFGILWQKFQQEH